MGLKELFEQNILKFREAYYNNIVTKTYEINKNKIKKKNKYLKYKNKYLKLKNILLKNE
jgi:hypothetical protein